MKIKENIKVKLNVFYTLNRGVLYLAMLSFSIILIYEFLLKYVAAINNFQFNTGQIVIKLSYSYVSAFLFYFIIIHLPREKKKIGAFHFVNSRLGMLSQEINLMFSKIFFEDEEFFVELRKDLTRADFFELCKRARL